jgi:hypothetical protein
MPPYHGLKKQILSLLNCFQPHFLERFKVGSREEKKKKSGYADLVLLCGIPYPVFLASGSIRQRDKDPDSSII